MKSLSGLGLGLSLVFGCLLLALVAELYYLLWWKKRIANRSSEDGYKSTAREFLRKSCWRKPSSLGSATLNPQDLCSSDTQVHDPQVQFNGDSNKDFWCKPFGEDGVDDELTRLQNLAGPPRFLFTIKEETKEDMESEDAKSRERSRKGSRTRSLSDLFHIVDTPYLTPVASPPYFTPPRTPPGRTSHSSFFGSAGEAEFNWLRSSPPPNFQFLRDAEDKLQRRKLREEIELHAGFHKNDDESTSIFHKDEEENGPFITLIVGPPPPHHHHQHVVQCTPNSSQVLPLASSPPITSSSIMSQKLHQMN